ncbi:MAG: VOC family protein [Candidatus Falkowbacteria bacterium]
MQKIVPHLWFEKDAEKAVEYYAGIFKDAKIGKTTYYPEAAVEVSGKPAGSVMTVEFELMGQKFIAINGGEPFKFTEAVSFVVNCRDQEEIDYYWEKLTAGGDEKSQVCGWLKDKYGLSWQVVPEGMAEILGGSDKVKTERVMRALLKMGKIDIARLKQA